jgi:hypothetical protein
MAERSEKLQNVSETAIVGSFREALIALFPIMQALDCIEDDISHYDPFDRVADALWSELVVKSLQWKYGLEEAPALPAYGFTGREPTQDGDMGVFEDAKFVGRLVAFRGDRRFGSESFNAVAIERQDGSTVSFPVSGVSEYRWVRRGDAI